MTDTAESEKKSGTMSVPGAAFLGIGAMVAARLARSARRTTLRMPARWPWAQDFLAALTRPRALPPPA